MIEKRAAMIKLRNRRCPEEAAGNRDIRQKKDGRQNQHMNTKALSYENVSITYNGTETIHNVSFDLNRGEILGLLGESGSGKSTLIRAAMGVLDTDGRVSGGRIIYRPENRLDDLLGGQEINLCTLPEKKFRELRGAKIGMVFQDAGATLCPIRTIGSQIMESMFAHRSAGSRTTESKSAHRPVGSWITESMCAHRPVGSQIAGSMSANQTAESWNAESMSMHRTIRSRITESMSVHRRMDKKEAEEAALELFEKLNLQDPRKIWDSYPFELSGGMNQRVGIAMAMLMKPDILLADEPTSALDAVTAAQVIKELQEVHRLFGTSMILVTHDIAVMEKMADRIVVLQNGQIIESGRTSKILQHPEQPYTKRLIDSVPGLIIRKEAGDPYAGDSPDLSDSDSPDLSDSICGQNDADQYDNNWRFAVRPDVHSKHVNIGQSCGDSFCRVIRPNTDNSRHESDLGKRYNPDADVALLRTEHLSKTFHGKSGRETEAVRDVTFTLHRGEILGILGESGSGKSTLARLITGLTAADEGQIHLRNSDEISNRISAKGDGNCIPAKEDGFTENGRDKKSPTENEKDKKSLFVVQDKGKSVSYYKKIERKYVKKEKRIREKRKNGKKEGIGRIQMVFQNPANSFDPRRTLGHGIRESLMNRGISRREADKKAGELLVRCGLPAEYALRYPKEVSGGECQRAAIARALASEPDVLICDEATSSLDVTLQQQIVDLLKDLQAQQNLSVLFICHNLALAQMTCDRILVMHHGRIVEEAAPERVVRQMITEKTQ